MFASLLYTIPNVFFKAYRGVVVEGLCLCPICINCIRRTSINQPPGTSGRRPTHRTNSNQTLAHVAYYCPFYQHLRAGTVAQLCASEDINMFRLHRDQWTWRQLRELLGFWGELLRCQDSLAGGTGRTGAKRMHAMVDREWCHE